MGDNIVFKSSFTYGVCSVVGCHKNVKDGDRLVWHHIYETDEVLQQLYKSREKTPISRLKNSENPNVKARNEEELQLCVCVCVSDHSALHNTYSKKLAALAETDFETKLQHALQAPELQENWQTQQALASNEKQLQKVKQQQEKKTKELR